MIDEALTPPRLFSEAPVVDRSVSLRDRAKDSNSAISLPTSWVIILPSGELAKNLDGSVADFSTREAATAAQLILKSQYGFQSILGKSMVGRTVVRMASTRVR